jgi:hypothetical protein
LRSLAARILYKSGRTEEGATVLRLVRLAILVVLTLVALSLVMALARPETGGIEKLFLASGVLVLILGAAPMRRIGARKYPPSGSR